MGRSVDDLRLLLDVIGAPDVRDPEAVNFDLPYDRHSKPMIGVVRSGGQGPFAAPVGDTCQEALSDAATALEALGYPVREIEVPQLGEAAALWWQLAVSELAVSGFSEFMTMVDGSTGTLFWNNIVDIVRREFGEPALATTSEALTRRSWVKRQLSELMSEFPILLTAASCEPPFVVDSDVESADRTEELMAHQWANLAVPAMAVPAVGMGTMVREAGAPLGVQIIGRSYADRQVLDVAADLERVRPVALPIEPRVSLP